MLAMPCMSLSRVSQAFEQEIHASNEFVFKIYTRQLWDSGIQYFVKRSSLVSFCRRNHDTRPGPGPAGTVCLRL